MGPIAIRCDGGSAIGSGHVGRSLPIAKALRERGSQVVFVGEYDGTAAWLVGSADFEIVPPVAAPCGLAAEEWGAAVVDLYIHDGEAQVCRLAAELPIATIGEATRCSAAGLWVDYHAGSGTASGPRRLGGPEYVPLDPRFAGARRTRDAIERVLVMTGGSVHFDDLSARVADAAADAFPNAQIVAPASVARLATCAVTPLDSPFDLAELAPTIDLAVVGAGMTTYELVCAGIPTVAMALVDNQRIVIDGCRATGIALPVDAIGRDPVPEVEAALAQMQDPGLRSELSRRAIGTVDGRGAARVAEALLAAWTGGGQPHSAR